MMISDEQVRLAVEYLRTSDAYSVTLPATSDPAAKELVGRVVESLRTLPDIRDDRVAHARMLIEEDLPTSDELATKLIGRVLSDAVR